MTHSANTMTINLKDCFLEHVIYKNIVTRLYNYQIIHDLDMRL